MAAGPGSRVGLLYFVSTLVGLSSLVVVTSLFMPWVVAPSGLFGSGSQTLSAFSMAWAVAVEHELEISLYFVFVLALAIICLGIIVIAMVGLTEGGWATWVKVSLLLLSFVVLVIALLAFSVALGVSAERPKEFQLGAGIFIFALGSLMTFAGCLWGAIALRSPG